MDCHFSCGVFKLDIPPNPTTLECSPQQRPYQHTTRYIGIKQTTKLLFQPRRKQTQAMDEQGDRVDLQWVILCRKYVQGSRGRMLVSILVKSQNLLSLQSVFKLWPNQLNIIVNTSLICRTITTLIIEIIILII